MKALTAKASRVRVTVLMATVLVLMGSCARWLPASASGLFGIRISEGKLPPAQMRSDYRHTLSAEGGSKPYHWKVERGHLPAGLQLEDDGTIHGRAELPGEYWFDATVTDSTGEAHVGATLSLSVIGNGLAIVTTRPDLPWGRVGSEYSARLTAAGAPSPYFWNADGLPRGLSISAKGTISGAPTEAGDFQIVAHVHNLAGEQTERKFSIHVSAAAVDHFSGVITSKSKLPTGRWSTAKVGDRWVFVTPEGHPFWMMGMWYVAGDEHKDERGSSFDQRGRYKFGLEASRWLQANRRLRSWGFNAIGPYSYRMMLPFDSEPQWQGSEQPVKMPFVWIMHNPAISGCKEGVFKNLFGGLDPQNHVLGDQGHANFPDVFDPAWMRNADTVIRGDQELASIVQSPYLIGVFGDDTDYVSGFGPGADFVTQPTGKNHAHLGYLALITSPTQEKHKESGAAYSDRQVYTKLRLRDFLRQKYGTIESLNSAWGSSYSTFDSDGGWPSGNGLLDENGRTAHKWLGSGELELRAGSGANANMVRDLDEFLYLIARQFLETERDALRAVAPSTLFFGPSTIGGWWAPARAPIYRAARETLDVISVTTDGSQEQVDFITRAAGDTPLIIWEGAVANSDSSQWRHPTMKDGKARWFVESQEQRGERYRQDVTRLFEARSAGGTHPFIGHLWWAWTDSIPEERNWGVVSLLDNAYDGYEAGKSFGVDAWGYQTGGEERNYGDFITPARAVNFSVSERLANEQH